MATRFEHQFPQNRASIAFFFYKKGKYVIFFIYIKAYTKAPLLSGAFVQHSRL